MNLNLIRKELVRAIKVIVKNKLEKEEEIKLLEET
jgi:hypothetical protein